MKGAGGGGEDRSGRGYKTGNRRDPCGDGKLLCPDCLSDNILCYYTANSHYRENPVKGARNLSVLFVLKKKR